MGAVIEAVVGRAALETYLGLVGVAGAVGGGVALLPADEAHGVLVHLLEALLDSLVVGELGVFLPAFFLCHVGWVFLQLRSEVG